MSRLFLALAVGLFAALSAPGGFAQDRAALHSDILGLSKKLDDQNAKIDALSQQILKLQQEVEQGKNSTVAPATAGISEESVTPAPMLSGNMHIVARGETLTSIAKQYHVGIDELQKFNHIEDARKLQLGQKLGIPAAVIPAAVTPTPAAVPATSPAP